MPKNAGIVCLDWRSALILISDADTDEHLQLIDSGVLKQLIAEKWKTFAKVCVVAAFCTTYTFLYLSLYIFLSVSSQFQTSKYRK